MAELDSEWENEKRKCRGKFISSFSLEDKFQLTSSLLPWDPNVEARAWALGLVKGLAAVTGEE